MKKYFFPLLIIFLFSLWSLRSLFHPGFIYSHDSLWHVERIQNISTLITSQFPVRWSPSLDHGYGAPLFNFTYPAPYYLGSLLMFIGLGPVASYKILLLIAYILGGVGVYLLGRKHVPTGLVAAVLYILIPYQYLDIFVRGALGEVFALGLAPWVFLAISTIESRQKLNWFAPLPFVLLLLSHNFFSYLIGAMIVFFALTIYQQKKLIFSSLLLSITLSSFFVLPAMLEKNLLLYTQTPNTDYASHFVYPSQLISTAWNYLGSMPGYNASEMSFQLGIPTVIIFALYLATPASRKKIVYLVTFLVSLFLMLPYSDFIWRSIPILSIIQFPWRFLGILTVITPLFYLSVADSFGHKPVFKYFSYVLVFVALFTTYSYARPLKWLNDDEFMQLHYEYAGGTMSAHREEIVPKWASLERYEPAGGRLKIAGAEPTGLVEQDSSLSFNLITDQHDLTGVWHRNYYPSWQGRVDGQSMQLSPTDSGEISFKLLTGEHKYEIYLGSTAYAKLGNTLSLIGLFICGYLAYVDKGSTSPANSKSSRSKTS
jgi:hypothetical protein